MSKSDDKLETEVKFFVGDLAELRERLLSRRAELKRPRTYEHNILFDDAVGTLEGQGKLLRLRQDESTRITFKGETPEQVSSEVRVREEIEVSVGDFQKTSEILEKIGFVNRLIYEKYRETFQIGGVEVVLDDMPFGSFIELEGSESDIRQTASDLQLDWDKRILMNYLELHLQLTTCYELPFQDITFDNYHAYPVTDIESILFDAS